MSQASSCSAPGCRRPPIYGPRGGSKLTCREHREQGHTNLNSRCCYVPGCPVTANYGKPGEKPSSCGGHRRHGDVNINRCEVSKATRRNKPRRVHKSKAIAAPRAEPLADRAPMSSVPSCTEDQSRKRRHALPGFSPPPSNMKSPAATTSGDIRTRSKTGSLKKPRYGSLKRLQFDEEIHRSMPPSFSSPQARAKGTAQQLSPAQVRQCDGPDSFSWDQLQAQSSGSVHAAQSLAWGMAVSSQAEQQQQQQLVAGLSSPPFQTYSYPRSPQVPMPMYQGYMAGHSGGHCMASPAELTTPSTTAASPVQQYTSAGYGYGVMSPHAGLPNTLSTPKLKALMAAIATDGGRPGMVMGVQSPRSPGIDALLFAAAAKEMG